MIRTKENSDILKLLNVSYHYPNRKGIDRISLTVKKGEFILLVGVTGSGKTTIFRVASMELRPDTGEICLLEQRSSRLKRKEYPLWRRQMGIIYQDLKLLSDRSVLENIKLVALCEHRLNASPKTRSLRVLHKVGMDDKLTSLPTELSTGEQQRVAIARALVNEPFIVLADEPVSNLDRKTSDGIAEILHKISLSGTSMIVATHQPERFEKFNPRVIRVHQGRMYE